MLSKPRTFTLATMAFSLATLLLPCCRKDEEKQLPWDALVQVGDSVLTMSRVVEQIPINLSPADSAALFNAIVDRWVEEQLLFNLAEDNLSHLGDLEKKVESYRRSLIISEYRRMMVAARMTPITEDSVKSYYSRHKGEMTLDRPLVKGVYLKIDDGADRLPQIRNWVYDATPESADKIEKYGLKNAVEYDYFVDRWVDWQVIADQIPYRFSNPSEFLAHNSEFQTEANGSIYFLKVTEYKAPGDTIPYDFAANNIREMLSIEQKNNVDQDFFKQIYKKGVKDNKIIPILYDPLTHQRVDPGTKENNNKLNINNIQKK